MADPALLSTLNPPRLPEGAPVAAIQDILLAAALGLALGFAVAALYARLARARRLPARLALERIRAAERHPPGERVALAAWALRDYAEARHGLAPDAGARDGWLAALARCTGGRTEDAEVLAAALYAPADAATADRAVAAARALVR